MTTQTPNVPQAGLLTTDQIAQFKRDGFLVLPAVLDPELCRQTRDDMWNTIATYLPRMKRDDPSTWGPLTEQETAKLEAQRPAIGGEPYFYGKGHRFYIRNGTEQHLLDLAPRAMWQVAEQLLGKDTVVWLYHWPGFYVRRHRRRSRQSSRRCDKKLSRERILHHRASAAPAQNRPGVAQWARNARALLHPTQ